MKALLFNNERFKVECGKTAWGKENIYDNFPISTLSSMNQEHLSLSFLMKDEKSFLVEKQRQGKPLEEHFL